MTRLRHHRIRDHTGAESAALTVLSEPIGPFDRDTPVQLVIEDILGRIHRLENYDQQRGDFSLDATVLAPGEPVGEGTLLNVFNVGAVIHREISEAYHLRAVITAGSAFTLAAVIRGGASFTVDARIV
jgi:hypothetical protein